MQSLYTRLCYQHIATMLPQKTTISTLMHINEPKYVAYVMDCVSLTL